MGETTRINKLIDSTTLTFIEKYGKVELVKSCLYFTPNNEEKLVCSIENDPQEAVKYLIHWIKYKYNLHPEGSPGNSNFKCKVTNS